MSGERKAQYFSGQGDAGETGLLGEGRYKKSELRFEVLGTIDELTSILGVAKSNLSDASLKEDLSNIQRNLYRVMTEISYLDQRKITTLSITEESVALLETRIEELGNSISMPADFILPGDSTKAALVDMARSVSRRVERRLCEFDHETGVHNKSILKYLNRLSSYFFVLELTILKDQGILSPTLAKGK